MVRRSEAVLSSLEERFARQSRHGALADDREAHSSQMTLFDEAEALPTWWRELVDALDGADIDRTTPIDALAMLSKLKRMIHERE